MSLRFLQGLMSLDNTGGILNYNLTDMRYICPYRTCNADAPVAHNFHIPVDFRNTAPWSALLESWRLFVSMHIQYTSHGTSSTSFRTTEWATVAALLFVSWRVLPNNTVVWERPVVDTYEAGLIEFPADFRKEMFELVFLHKDEPTRHSRYASVAHLPTGAHA